LQNNKLVPQQFNNPANPEMHRKTMIELLKQFKRIDAFVASHTGGTITGVGEVLKDKMKNVRICAVGRLLRRSFRRRTCITRFRGLAHALSRRFSTGTFWTKSFRSATRTRPFALDVWRRRKVSSWAFRPVPLAALR
jgi:hypothetical protein